MSKSPAEVGKELFEKEEAEGRAAAKKFDPKLLAQETDKEQVLIDPALGEIHFYFIRVDEAKKLYEIPDLHERSLNIIHTMLKKAYPDLTLEDVKAFPSFKADRLMQIFNEATTLFRSPASSPRLDKK
jgi:hypothetical protein